jgi:hypothetical protein
VDLEAVDPGHVGEGGLGRDELGVHLQQQVRERAAKVGTVDLCAHTERERV